MTYAEKLKDPRWQKKRLEIFNRDDFTCRVCGSTTDTLHVHHVRYLRGRNPWEYREFYFVTLCENCHKAEEREIKLATQKRGTTISHFRSLVAAPDPPPWGNTEGPTDEEKTRPPTPDEIGQFFKGLRAMMDESDCDTGKEGL